MKIKPYLKGMGIGIIVTSLILIISGNLNKGMSDEDVIKRAKELGMVESTTLGKPYVNDGSSSIENAEVIDDTDESLVSSNNVNNDDKIKTDNNADNNTNASDANKEISNNTSSSDNGKDTSTAKTNSKKTVTVTISSGQSSETVSNSVKEAGLAEDDTAFNKYLCENGYDKRLRVGTYEIPEDADFETVSKYLCGMITD